MKYVPATFHFLFMFLLHLAIMTPNLGEKFLCHQYAIYHIISKSVLGDSLFFVLMASEKLNNLFKMECLLG